MDAGNRRADYELDGLLGPVGAARAEDGTIFISEAEANRVIAVSVSGETRVLASDLDRPMHLATADGKVYVPEFVADRIRIIDAKTGRILGTIGDSSIFDAPAAIAVASDGIIYVADFYHHRIVVLSPDGRVLRFIGSKGDSSGEFFYPTDINIGEDDNLYIADAYNHRVQVFSREGQFQKIWGRYGSGKSEFNIAQGLGVSREMNIYVADAENNRVQAFDANGIFLGAWTGIDYPSDIVVLPGGSVFAVLNHAGQFVFLKKENMR